MEEPILAYVKRRLEASRGEWPRIAVATGVPYFTITNLAQGKVPNPRIGTVQPLFDYFREEEARVA